jgi:thioredoxin reductase
MSIGAYPTEGSENRRSATVILLSRRRGGFLMVKVLQLGRAMFDVIVAGGGPAGLSASLMLGRCRRRVLLCDTGMPRNRSSHALHGYLTRDGISPAEFNALGRADLVKYGVEYRPTAITDVERLERRFKVTIAPAQIEECRYVLIATGVTDELPPIPGIDACYGRSVHHCPYCDGWEWRDRRLAVLGERSAGVGLALSLKSWSGQVDLCLDGGRISRRDRERLHRNGVGLRAQRIAALEHTDGRLQAVTFASEPPLPAEALFFTTGQHMQCDLAARLGCIFNRRGTVETGNQCGTNVAGVYVAGDASRDAQFVIVAAAEGVKAALAINRALQQEELVQ